MTVLVDAVDNEAAQPRLEHDLDRTVPELSDDGVGFLALRESLGGGPLS